MTDPALPESARPSITVVAGKEFRRGVVAFFDALLYAAANNYHHNPEINKQCEIENEILTRYARMILSEISPDDSMEWLAVTDLCKRIQELEDELRARPSAPNDEAIYPAPDGISQETWDGMSANDRGQFLRYIAYSEGWKAATTHAPNDEAREALRAYVQAQGAMRDDWAESENSPLRRKELWQRLHACEDAARRVLGQGEKG